MRLFIIILLCQITFLFACQQETKTTGSLPENLINESAKARLDSTMDKLIVDSLVVGASALIFEKGEEVYFKSVGYADREANRPMDRNTIVTIYSRTKPITGTTLMTLYEKDSFKLTDPLSRYAPEFSDMQVVERLDHNDEMVLVPVNRPITIADITRHTAGFSRRSDLGLNKLAGEADLLNPESTLSEMAEKLSRIPLGYHPGQRWEYGISVDVQAYLAEKLAGKPFDEYMREVILEPLGMDETSYFVPESKRDRMAAIYRKTDKGLERAPEEIHSINYQQGPMHPGGYGLTATIDDYMKFAQMLVNKGTFNGRKILKPETVELMASNHLPAVEDSSFLVSKGQVGFGIDFAVRTAPPKTLEENRGEVGEFFWDGAATTLFWVDPENELTAVLFVQIMPFQGEVHKRFRAAVYGPFKAVKK